MATTTPFPDQLTLQQKIKSILRRNNSQKYKKEQEELEAIEKTKQEQQTQLSQQLAQEKIKALKNKLDTLIEQHPDSRSFLIKILGIFKDRTKSDYAKVIPSALLDILNNQNISQYDGNRLLILRDLQQEKIIEQIKYILNKKYFIIGTTIIFLKDHQVQVVSLDDLTPLEHFQIGNISGQDDVNIDKDRQEKQKQIAKQKIETFKTLLTEDQRRVFEDYVNVKIEQNGQIKRNINAMGYSKGGVSWSDIPEILKTPLDL